MSKIGKTELSGTMSGGSMNRERIGNLAITGILGAIAYILMWLEFPIPIMPPFIKFDFSDFPALLAAFPWGRLQALWWN